MLLLSLTCLTCLVPGEAGLLGAGRGDGSCAAPPFRADTADLAWPGGCPAWAPCCTEYGYCHPRAGWEQELFRDCNGESNGLDLPLRSVILTGAASLYSLLFKGHYKQSWRRGTLVTRVRMMNFLE